MTQETLFSQSSISTELQMGTHEVFKNDELEVLRIVGRNDRLNVLTDKYEITIFGAMRKSLLEEKQSKLIKVLKSYNAEICQRLIKLKREFERR